MSEIEIYDATAEEPRDLPAVRAYEAMVTRAEVTVDDVVAQRDKIKSVMERVMEPEIHYGHIPGIAKPTLFKPGAELLNTTFRLAPAYQSERIFHDDLHLTVVSKCVLTHAPSGIVLGEGEGLCSSRESKYAYRNAQRVCPACGTEAIIKGKAEYGGGWLCWKKNGGCGAKFAEGDSAIESQQVGKAANEDVPDTWNTILKMADKRALVAAVLNCTAASDIFTQDVEDQPAAKVSAGEPRAERVASHAAQTSVPDAHPLEDVEQPSPAESPSSQLTELPGETFEDMFQGAVATEVGDQKATPSQRKKLDVLVGQLREAGPLHTEHLYQAVATLRGVDPDGFVPEDPHWGPLRDELTKDEASNLVDRLSRLQENVAAAK